MNAIIAVQEVQLLQLHGWNVSRVARGMGLSRVELDIRLARLGIQRENVRSRCLGSPAADSATLLLHLTHHEWNVSRVARLLGTTRGTIYARMARFGIQRQRVRKSPSRRVRPSA